MYEHIWTYFIYNIIYVYEYLCMFIHIYTYLCMKIFLTEDITNVHINEYKIDIYFGNSIKLKNRK